MRIAVTGASGFVGGRAVRWLRAHGHEVHPFGRRPADALRHPIHGYVSWDLAKGPTSLPVVDAVVHSGAHVGDSGDEAAFQAVNVDGIHALLASVPESVRIVHISSASVYDLASPTVWITESAPLGARHFNAYSRTKVEAERILRASGRSCVILRPHLIYGPRDTHLLPGILAARRFGWVPAYGNGTNLLSVTHVDNLAMAIERALAPEAPSGAYNVSDGGAGTVDEILRALLTRSGNASRVAYIPRAVAWPVAAFLDALPDAIRGRGDRKLSRYLVSHMTKEFTMDITRARELLGYQPRWTFRDGPLTDDPA